MLIFSFVYVTYSTRRQEPFQTFPAMIKNDCAPWAGPAFTVAIQHDSGHVIYISIWRAPDINYPTTFPILNDVAVEQDGFAYILPELGPFLPLHGEVAFNIVSVEQLVVGRFSLMSARGDMYQGQFVAMWDHEVVYCG